MPAYLVDLDSHCDHPSCSKRATVELRDGRNERVGRYCTKHGDEALARRRADEA